jgi:hypothetical protein
LIVIRKGEQEIPGLTDINVPRRLGPKRASHIRKLFNLTKEDDVRKYVIKRPLALKEGKKQRFQAPRIQRLVTPVVLQVRNPVKHFTLSMLTDILAISSLSAQETPFGIEETPRRGPQGSRS